MSLTSLPALQAVLSVAQDGSFVAASRRLGLSAAAVSKSISRLETELGVKLFQRTTRTVALTAEGERLVSGVRPLLGELDALTQELKDTSSQPGGMLRVSVPPIFGRLVLMPVMGEFLRLYPAMNVDLSLDARLSNLVEDKIDLAIRAGELPDNANLVARPIMRSRALLCASPIYVEQFGMPGSVEDLQLHKAVLLRNPGSQIPRQWQLGKQLQVPMPAARLIVDDIDALRSGVLQGIGVGQLFDFISRPLIDRGELVELLPSVQSEPQILNAVYQDRRLVSPRIRAMIDFLLSRLG